MPGICSITNFITGFKSRSVMFWIIIIDTNKEPSWICNSWSVSSYPNKHTFKILLKNDYDSYARRHLGWKQYKKVTKKNWQDKTKSFSTPYFCPTLTKNDDVFCIENIIPGCRRWFSHLNETIWKTFTFIWKNDTSFRKNDT